MKLKRVIYVTRLSIPKKGPRSIQILRNCVALAAQNIEVFLFVKSNTFPNMESLCLYYGLQTPQNLHIKTLPLLLTFSPFLIALFVSIKTILGGRDSASFYVRDYTLAKYIIRLKWLHHIPVFFEVHGAPRVSDGNIMIVNKESRNRSKPKSIDFVLKNSDGLICAFKEIEDFLLNNHVRTPMFFAWFGTEPNKEFCYDFSSRRGIYYVGSFSRSYSPELFIEAMKYVRDEKLILIGGYSEEEISYVKNYAKKGGVFDRIVFKDYIPPAEVSTHLKQAKVAISLWAGLKLTDYFSNGLPVVACGDPGKGILRDNDNCILFQPKDPKSLASAINKILDNPALAEILARNAYGSAQEYSWCRRAEKIVNFIESNIVNLNQRIQSRIT